MIYGTSLVWVLAAALAYYLIGAIWYSPMLFAKAWMHELGRKSGEMKMSVEPMVISFLAVVLAVIVEAYFIHATKTVTPWRGAWLGAKLWLGFAGTTGLINNAFQSQSKKLWLIDQGYHLVGLVVAGAILVH